MSLSNLSVANKQAVRNFPLATLQFDPTRLLPIKHQTKTQGTTAMAMPSIATAISNEGKIKSWAKSLSVPALGAFGAAVVSVIAGNIKFYRLDTERLSIAKGIVNPNLTHATFKGSNIYRWISEDPVAAFAELSKGKKNLADATGDRAALTRIAALEARAAKLNFSALPWFKRIGKLPRTYFYIGTGLALLSIGLQLYKSFKAAASQAKGNQYSLPVRASKERFTLTGMAAI